MESKILIVKIPNIDTVVCLIPSEAIQSPEKNSAIFCLGVISWLLALGSTVGEEAGRSYSLISKLYSCYQLCPSPFLSTITGVLWCGTTSSPFSHVSLCSGGVGGVVWIYGRGDRTWGKSTSSVYGWSASPPNSSHGSHSCLKGPLEVPCSDPLWGPVRGVDGSVPIVDA